MQMRPAGLASFTLGAQDISLRYTLTLLHGQAAQVRVERLDPTTVVEDDDGAVTSAP